MRRDPRKSLGVSPEGRKLERGRAGIDQFIDPRSAFLRIDGCIKREIDAGLRRRLLRLVGETLRRGDQAAVVIGHIDDGRDAAGRSTFCRPDEVLLPQLAATVNLRVNRAWKHQISASAVSLAGWRGTLAYGLHPAVTNQDISVLDDAVRQDHGSCKDFIGHRATPSCPASFL